MNVTPIQVYQEVLAQGGSQVQAQVAAALVSGIESNGDPQILSGGVGPAQGLFQFEPGTWTGGAGGGRNGLPSTVGASSWQQQVTGFINDTGGKGGSNFQAWGPDLMADGGDPNSASNPAYGYTGGPQKGSKVGNIIAQNSASWGAAAPADLSGGGSVDTQGTGTGGTNTNPQDSVQVGGQTYTGKTSQTSALASISSTMGSYGFSGQDLKDLTTFAWGEITGNVDPSQVVLDLQNQPVFNNRFPGLKERTAAGFDAISVSDYINYETAALQQARALGLPEGFMSKQEIGSLIAGNVSADELSNRLNNVYVVANNSTPEVKAQLKAYFGADITPGGLAALALDPKKAEPILQQQLTAAQLGGAGVSAGLGAVSKGTAMEIAQTGITQSGIQSGIGQIAPLAALETALPGQTTNAGANTVDVDQLAKGQFLSSAADQRALQVAQESRLAPFKGGGGSVATQKGVVGLGSASSSGAPSQ